MDPKFRTWHIVFQFGRVWGVAMVVFMWMTGCAFRPANPQQLEALGWQELTTAAPLRAWARPHLGPHALVVFESDGAAWLSMGTKAPADPTPVRAMGLELAQVLERALASQKNNEGPVVYVGRHCQFLGGAGAAHPKPADCQTDALWTEARFSPRVVSDMRALLAQLAHQMPHIQTWTLLGFSGGGTLAALVGMARHQQHQDVRCVITLASPLDLRAWAQLQRMSSLSLSLDPADQAMQLEQIPSVHWFGSADRKVPLASAGRLLEEPALADRFKTLAGVGHGAEWVSIGIDKIGQGCIP